MTVASAETPELPRAEPIEHVSDAESEGPVVVDGSKKKKKKKPKKKKKADSAENGGRVPPETLAVVPTAEDAARWASELKRGARTVSVQPWLLLQERERPKLNLLRTPSCASFSLRTPRLLLRQVEVGDTTAIRRIKMEPQVQRTQLYGSPSAGDIKDSFQTRYVASSIPRLEVGPVWRDEYVFAISAKEGSKISVAPAGDVRISNRITNADGYLGNIALSLEETSSSPPPSLRPEKGKVWVHPPASVCAEAGLEGKMFYELHPQLWGQGLVSEAFAEVLRFAIEEVGCAAVTADPTIGNDASIRLCTKHGMTFTHEGANNSFRKPQLFHRITREEWFRRNRGTDGKSADPWGGKETCRWCLDFRKRPGVVCACGWAKYCSWECRRADWVCRGGHQRECDAE